MTQPDFLAELIGSPARAKVLRMFLFNDGKLLGLEEAARRAGVSGSGAQRELRALEKLGVIKRIEVASSEEERAPASRGSRTKKLVRTKSKVVSMWTLDGDLVYLSALSTFVHEISPVHHDKIVSALRRGGKLAAVILSGQFLGDPSRPADIIVAADAYNERRLDKAVRGLEPICGREIRYAVFTTPEFRYRLTVQDRLLRDTLDFPHLVLLDKTQLL